MSLRKWFRRWRYRRLEAEMLELKNVRSDIQLMLDGAAHVPQFIANFMAENNRNIDKLELKLDALRKEGL